jgi:hypothetical protein
MRPTLGRTGAAAGHLPASPGHTGSTGNAFISYQDSVAEQLRQQADNAWVTIDVTGKPADIVLKESLAILSARLGVRFT